MASVVAEEEGDVVVAEEDTAVVVVTVMEEEEVMVVVEVTEEEEVMGAVEAVVVMGLVTSAENKVTWRETAPKVAVVDTEEVAAVGSAVEEAEGAATAVESRVISRGTAQAAVAK